MSEQDDYTCASCPDTWARLNELLAKLAKAEKERDQYKASAGTCAGYLQDHMEIHGRAKNALSRHGIAHPEGTHAVNVLVANIDRATAERDQALAKLAAAEKDAAEWKESSRAWQEQATVYHLERDAALAKLAEAERERDENQAAQRSIICELQQAMADVFCRLSPPTNRFTTWREQVIAAIDSIMAERSTLAAQLAEARELLADLATGIGHPNPDKREKKDCLIRARIAAFLAPPSDRGEGDKP